MTLSGTHITTTGMNITMIMGVPRPTAICQKFSR
jgi:hypothetical protein